MSIRTERVSSAIKRTLSASISDLASEKGLGLASVSMVKLSKDLSVASVFINFLTSKQNISVEQFLELLHNNKGNLRSLVAREVRLRFTPELRFFYDDTLEQMEHIDNLLDEVKKNYPYKEHYGDESVYKTDRFKKL